MQRPSCGRLTALQQRVDTLTKDVEQTWSSEAAKEAAQVMPLVSALEEQVRVCEQEQGKTKSVFEERLAALRERHAKVVANYVKRKEQGAELLVASAAVKAAVRYGQEGARAARGRARRRHGCHRGRTQGGGGDQGGRRAGVQRDGAG